MFSRVFARIHIGIYNVNKYFLKTVSFKSCWIDILPVLKLPVPFQQLQIIYCFQNLFVHTYLYIEVYIICIQYNFHNNISLAYNADNLERTARHFLAIWLLNGQAFLTPHRLRNGTGCQDGAKHIRDVEHEFHNLRRCKLYDDFRYELFTKASICNYAFTFVSDQDNFIYLLSNCDNVDLDMCYSNSVDFWLEYWHH